MTVLLWTAVPIQHCTPAMTTFRETTEVLRVADNAVIGGDGMPVSNHPGNPTLQHLQAGGIALFGYSNSRAARYARLLLERVYITKSGAVGVRRRF